MTRPRPRTAAVVMPLDAANLEQVREIGGEVQAEPEAVRADVEIVRHDALAAAALP
jgi:hypothetical protein